MTPQRRTALVSIGAAAALAALKLGAGIASGSLGLVTEALHSGTDLVAALLTFFAIGVAGRPADDAHQYGHGKAEHLAALAEATVLGLVSVAVAALAVARLAGATEHSVDPAWWVFVVVALVLAIDASRTVISLRTARRFRSEALRANALHFGSDLVGTFAVLGGLVAASAGAPEGDSIAALFVAALVLVAAGRLIRRNVDVLMDRAPADAEEAARAAIARIEPPVELSRLRLRQAAGRMFADVVISVSPEAAVGQGHAAADRVESALDRVLPGSDVVVHVEPSREEAALRERAHAAALTVPRVREIHNLSVVTLDDGATELSLHLKLPGELPLDEAHAIAEQVERAICSAVPEIASVQTHLEPLAEAGEGEVVQVAAELAEAVTRAAGGPPRELRLMRTEQGVVAFVTLGLDPGSTLAEAHDHASRVEERLRRARPDVADVIVHTEP
jgi:cation diffusion facilitator family transporter